MAVYDEHERVTPLEPRRFNRRVRSPDGSAVGPAFAVAVLVLLGLMFILGLRNGDEAPRANSPAPTNAPVTLPQSPATSPSAPSK